MHVICCKRHLPFHPNACYAKASWYPLISPMRILTDRAVCVICRPARPTTPAPSCCCCQVDKAFRRELGSRPEIWDDASKAFRDRARPPCDPRVVPRRTPLELLGKGPEGAALQVGACRQLAAAGGPGRAGAAAASHPR